MRFVSPQKGSLIATFDGACRCLGRFEDRDADGVRDLLMGSGWPKYSYSWISSKDCHRIGESPAPKEYYVVPIGDLNRDGNIDFASHVGSEPSRVKITSGRDGSELWWKARARGWQWRRVSIRGHRRESRRRSGRDRQLLGDLQTPRTTDDAVVEIIHACTRSSWTISATRTPTSGNAILVPLPSPMATIV